MKKLMKSKKGIAPALLLVLIPAIPWILGLTLFGVPVFATWFKMATTPAKPVSPWIIIVGCFILIIWLKGRKK